MGSMRSLWKVVVFCNDVRLRERARLEGPDGFGLLHDGTAAVADMKCLRKEVPSQEIDNDDLAAVVAVAALHEACHLLRAAAWGMTRERVERELYISRVLECGVGYDIDADDIEVDAAAGADAAQRAAAHADG